MLDCRPLVTGHKICHHTAIFLAMPLSVLERVRSLREEINALKQENELYKHQKGSVAESDRERRRQRIQEIKDELMAMTEWKKL